MCAEFGWNWLWFGSKHYSNTRLYMSMCLCLVTSFSLVTGLFIPVVCPLQAAIKTDKQREKQYEPERDGKHWVVECGV